jgi:hypothetical protein
VGVVQRNPDQGAPKMTATIPTVRRSDLDSLLTALRQNHAARLDLVTSTANMTMRNGQLVIERPLVSENGEAQGEVEQIVLDTLDTFVSGLAEHTGIPVKYLRTLISEEERRQASAIVIAGAKLYGDDSLLDHNVNHWFQNQARQVLIRAYGDFESGRGVARALLSNSFRIVDNLDVLFPVLGALRDSGIEVDVTKCDLTERGTMYVEIEAPQLFQDGGPFVHGYRHARSGRSGHDFPIVHAGLILRNGELGNGSITLTPSVKVRVCSNGMTVTKEQFRKIHLGAKMDDGIWSEETHGKYLALVQSQVRDYVGTVLNAEWLARQVDRLNGVAAPAVAPEDTERAVKVLGKELAWSQEQQDAILASYIGGSMLTVGGWIQAATDVAQTVESADVEFDLLVSAERIPEVLAGARIAG